MRAREITPLALDSYQRAARVILSNHLITSTYPDRIALPLLRRWATELRDDLLELFGYRLEVTETTARLFTVSDRLNPSAPARTASERTFDRTRYAYLALCLAALGRAGNQITLSELGRSRRGRRRAGRRRRTLHRSCVRPRRLRRRSGLARSQRSHRPRRR